MESYKWRGIAKPFLCYMVHLNTIYRWAVWREEKIHQMIRVCHFEWKHISECNSLSKQHKNDRHKEFLFKQIFYAIQQHLCAIYKISCSYIEVQQNHQHKNRENDFADE